MSASEPATETTSAPVTSAAGAVTSPARRRRGRTKAAVPEVISDAERWFPPGQPRQASPQQRKEQNLTLLLLLLISGVGVSAWLTGKWLLNEHTPDGQQYVPAELAVLANRPKNAALEFHHSLCVLDFDRASKLAGGAAVALVEQRRSACDAACLKTRRQRSKVTATRATLIESQGRYATASAECDTGSTLDAAQYKLRYDSGQWLVVDVATPKAP